MNCTQEKYLRYEEWSSEASSSPLQQFSSKVKSMPTSAVNYINEAYDKGLDRIYSLSRSLHVHPLNNQLQNDSGSTKNVLDPHGMYLHHWNKIFLVSCIISVSLDPIFLYIPLIDSTKKCIDFDKTLEITSCVLRSFTDLFYVYHIILQFRTGFIPPSSRGFGRGELIEDKSSIAKRYLSSYFLVDVLAVLPLPQVLILLISPSLSNPASLITKGILKVAICIQGIPRVMRIFPITKEVTRSSGLIVETAWAGAVFNLFLYILASHVLGAFWYLFSIERQYVCWEETCGEHQNFDANIFYCGFERHEDYSFLNSSCPLFQPDVTRESRDFDFGIYLDALQSHVVYKKKLFSKWSYSLWWGLRSLSSIGQSLDTSDFVLENLFAITVAITGLVLFSLLIGNMQKYLQSITSKVEEMRVRKQDTEQWMSHHMLPEHLRGRVRRYEQYKWQETRGVDEESLMNNLPSDLRTDIKRHLFWDLVKRVPMFEKMDDQLLDAMCDCLKPVLYTEGSLIYREGDPVDRMVFVIHGNLLTMATNGGRIGSFNCVNLHAGDFCGEELLTWVLDPNSTFCPPASTRTVKAVTDVEGFALIADNLKSVASQFRRLHRKQLRHAFRYYSQHWRTWSASFIQAAWRRYLGRKLDKAQREQENKLRNELGPPSVVDTIYASKFGGNALRLVQSRATISLGHSSTYI
ncbi:ligand-gated ion channel [Lithospermum erythrorhizon]|uniref:Ligand-gated ion channel n=1 Tax=Lithospermum erythrorhizon TaxID=34254 RepID=A0AAV3QWZ9_LITER